MAVQKNLEKLNLEKIKVQIGSADVEFDEQKLMKIKSLKQLKTQDTK
ncbi:MAG: hypothetical protein M5T52_00210 [Ignavibacteriaceae bacterium]|nr:hypothetical protein [Ignavibacteriaceae bacterium]